MAKAPEKKNEPSIILIFIEENFSSPLKFFQLGKMKKAEGKQGRERKEDGTTVVPPRVLLHSLITWSTQRLSKLQKNMPFGFQTGDYEN